MKKLLLTLASVAMALTAGATDYTVFDIETAANDNWTGDANGWSLNKDGFKITTAKDESTTDLLAPNNNTFAWRIYKGSTFTITASGTFKMNKVVITYDNYSENKYVVDLVLSEGWTGVLSVEDASLTATSSNGSATFTGKAQTAQARIKKVVVSGEGTLDPSAGGDPTPETLKFEKVTEVTSGKYILVCDGKIGTPVSAGSSFGRISLNGGEVTGNTAESVAANVFTITVADGKLTMQDASNRYYSMDDSHFTSFQMYEEANEFSYWTYSMTDGSLKMTNDKNTDCFVCQSQGAEGTFYTNVAPANAPEVYNLPCLYKLTSGDPTPPEPEKLTFEKVNEVITGKYVIVCDSKIGTPVASGAGYGRISLNGGDVTGNTCESVKENVFDITVADGKLTIKDAEGRYYSMDDSHFTSFQLYNEANEFSYWTYTMTDGAIKMTNDKNTDCFVCQSQGAEGTFYTNVAPAKAPEVYNLPSLYILKSGSVASIETEEDTPAVYYNLQGVRVENPTSGLYIVVKGNKSMKVAF